MCLSPVRLKDGTEVACRGCKLCLENRLNDLVGRCIAEQSTASKTVAVTLTYSGDTPSSVVLHYKDIQRMLANLRAPRGGNYKVRYICAGEYGRKRGRAHWHIILFFYGDSPNVSLDQNVDWKWWPHGYSFFQRPDYKGFRYCMKYALKQHKDIAATKQLTMSKKPPLGYKFFMKMADDIVAQRLPIHSPEYSFPHVVDKDGVPRIYWLQGRMRELFLDRYLIMWRLKYLEDPPETEFLLEKYLDPIAKREMENEQWQVTAGNVSGVRNGAKL